MKKVFVISAILFAIAFPFNYVYGSKVEMSVEKKESPCIFSGYAVYIRGEEAKTIKIKAYVEDDNIVAKFKDPKTAKMVTYLCYRDKFNRLYFIYDGHYYYFNL